MPPEPCDELDVAERDAVDGHVGQREVGDDRVHLAVGAEHVVHADVLQADRGPVALASVW